MTRAPAPSRPIRACASAALLASVVLSIAALPGPAAAVLILDPTSRVIAYSDTGGARLRNFTDPLASLPAVGTRSLSHGANSVDHTFRVDGGGVLLEFDHVRGEHQTGNPILPRVHSTLDLRFTVDVPTSYELLGHYEASDPIGKRMYYQVNFVDRTSGRLLYSTFQDSQFTANEAFQLGDQGGDWLDSQTGRLLGELLPGREYSLWVQALSSDMLFSEQSVSRASGSFRLTVLPEPSTGLLVGMGLAGIAARRRRAGRAAD